MGPFVLFELKLMDVWAMLLEGVGVSASECLSLLHFQFQFWTTGMPLGGLV